MSFSKSDPDVNIIPVYDTRVNVLKQMKEKVNYILEKPIHEVDYHKYSPDSFDSSQMTYNTLPNDRATFMSMSVYCELPLRATYISPGTPLTPDLPVFQSNRDALRSFAFDRIMQTSKLTINGEALTLEPYQFIDAYSTYQQTLEVQECDVGINVNDRYANYSSGDGASNNVLATYKDSIFNNVTPRGANDITIVSNTNTEAIIDVVIRSKIRIPPLELLSEKYQRPGLVGLDRVTWKFVFGNLQRAFSRDNNHPVPLSSLNVFVAGQPNLYIKWLTIPVDGYKDAILRAPSIKYPYYNPVRFTNSNLEAPVAPFGQAQLTSAAFSVTDTPHSIYIYVTNQDNYRNSLFPSCITSSDTFWTLDSVNITAGVKTGILSNASPTELYNISVKNGLKGTTLTEWLGTTQSFSQSISNPSIKYGLKGSCLRLFPGLDFNIDDDITMGSNSRFNFQVRVNTTNINELYTLQPQLNVIFVYEGYLKIYGNKASLIQSPIDQEQVKNLQPSEDINISDIRYFGGVPFGERFNTFSRKLSSAAKKGNKFLKDTKVISKGTKALSYLPTRASGPLRDVSDLADKYGYGGCMDEGGYLLEEVEIDKGGKMIPHKKLKSRLSKIYH